ncbi:hypothetical protein ACX80J_06850 [Arthrobacter sp. MDB2-24]
MASSAGTHGIDDGTTGTGWRTRWWGVRPAGNDDAGDWHYSWLLPGDVVCPIPGRTTPREET